MQIKKKVSLNGEWIKSGVDIHDGDIIKINDAGQPVEGEFGTRTVFRVDVGGLEKLLSWNQTSLNNCVDAFGEDSTKWVGKKVKVWILKMMVGGKLKNVVYLSAPDWTMNDDGTFKGNKDINVSSEVDYPENNLEDSPFDN